MSRAILVFNLSAGALFVFTVGHIVWSIGYSAGKRDVWNKQQSICGQRETCPFGPGIVGERHCEYDRTWSRCEPLAPTQGATR